MALTDKLTAIADAVRKKTGRTGLMTLDGMAAEIEGLSTGPDTSDATASAADIAEGKTAYVNGLKITGTGKGTSSSDGLQNISTGTATPYSSYQLYIPVDESMGTPVAIMTWSESAYQACDLTCGHMVYLNGYNLNGIKDVFGMIFVHDSANGTMITTYNKSQGNGYDPEKGYLMDRYSTSNDMDTADVFNYVVFYSRLVF